MKNYNRYPNKILMTADSIGGVWTYVVDMCRIFDSQNIKVALAVMGRKLQDYQRVEILRLHNVELFESEYKLEWMNNPWKDINAASEWLLKINKKFKPDIIHLNNYVFGSLNWRAPVLVTAHSDVFSWWQDVKKENPPDEWNEYFRRVSRGIHSADYLTAPSGYMLNAINRNFGSKTYQSVIYNARDKKFFRRDNKLNFIFSMGRIWDDAKNLMKLLDVSGRVNMPIIIAGENKNPDNGNSRRLKYVNFLGSLSAREISNYLSKAAIYVLPAKYEPFGLTVLEAALSGCALVLGDIPSLREIWGDNALYVNPDDEKSIADAIIFLKKDEDFRNNLANNSYNFARRFFSLERMNSEYMAVYNFLLTNQHQKSKILI